MIKVAIVGNIASGKTEFEKYLFKSSIRDSSSLDGFCTFPLFSFT